MIEEIYRSKFLIGLRCLYLGLLAILCFCFLSLWVGAVVTGEIFYCILGETIGGSKIVWFIFNTCLTGVIPIMGFAALTLITGLIAWCYRKICRLIPEYSNLRSLCRHHRIPVAHVVSLVYVIAFFVSTMIQSFYISEDVIGGFIGTTEKYGLGFLVVLGPLFLFGLVTIVVGVAWFCAALLPTMALLIRVVRYIFAQSIRVELLEE